jgi:hypothetical protein
VGAARLGTPVETPRVGARAAGSHGEGALGLREKRGGLRSRGLRGREVPSAGPPGGYGRAIGRRAAAGLPRGPDSSSRS